MTVEQLIERLKQLPAHLPVVATQGFMQDLTEVTEVEVGEPGRRAWTANVDYIVGDFVVLS